MTLSDLLRDDLWQVIENNIERDPNRIALDKHIDSPSIVATEVKYLQRARRKLPTYYAARCIMHPIAFEQSSGEGCARLKNFSGESCVDLTCGLGVDTYYLSKRFERVVAVERDEELAAIAVENFRRLGVGNVEVVNMSAEQYLDRCSKVDTIYIDPDRRSQGGRKMVCLADCLPNVELLLPRLRSLCRRLVVKLSPMFDVDEALRLFGDSGCVTTLSESGECKELLSEWCADRLSPRVGVAVVGGGTFETDPQLRTVDTSVGFDKGYKYLIVPDAALRQSRTTDAYFGSLGDVDFFNHHSFGFTNSLHSALVGHQFDIVRIEEYQPRLLKKSIARRIEIRTSHFPLSAQAICKSLGVREGGEEQWAFTEIENKLWAIEIKS